MQRDWTEDFAHENGNYTCQCVRCENSFRGHKRRLICKDCIRYGTGMTYTVDHIPSGETWRIVGIDVKNRKVCAAGYPPTLANLDDCKNFRDPRPVNDDEFEFRGRYFMSDSWI